MDRTKSERKVVSWWFDPKSKENKLKKKTIQVIESLGVLNTPGWFSRIRVCRYQKENKKRDEDECKVLAILRSHANRRVLAAAYDIGDGEMRWSHDYSMMMNGYATYLRRGFDGGRRHGCRRCRDGGGGGCWSGGALVLGRRHAALAVEDVLGRTEVDGLFAGDTAIVAPALGGGVGGAPVVRPAGAVAVVPHVRRRRRGQRRRPRLVRRRRLIGRVA